MRNPLFLIVPLLCCTLLAVQAESKEMYFSDPNTGYVYKVASTNVTPITTGTNYHSSLKIFRVKLDRGTQTPISKPEAIQTINFHSTLVDFDLHATPNYCYLVAVTSRTRRNVELYQWQRTQFDEMDKRDSFARPHSVQLFQIHKAFYVAIAQDQLHLAPYGQLQQYEYEEPTRFIGCAVLKFFPGSEKAIRYHQFIRLPFNPHYVTHLVSINANNSIVSSTRPNENHYLAFSLEPNWQAPGSNQAYTFLWSPLNDYFWPYRLPRNVSVVAPGPGQAHRYPILQLPYHSLQPLNFTRVHTSESIEPAEYCFSQLQRLLTDRDMQARMLIDSSKTLWRSTQSPQNNSRVGHQLTTISSQVIVHGNVIVKGSLIESPQVTLINQGGGTVSHVRDIVNSHSPSIVEHNLKQAFFKLRHIRDKLSRAVSAQYPPTGESQFSSRISFYGNIRANRVIFKHNGISNSNVRLNGLPFRQLEHELVGLRGAQDIQARVIFRGKVMADFLEIHGQVNKNYYFKDAVDITSKRIQVIDSVAHVAGPQLPAMTFQSISAPQLVLSPNATINGIRLDEFVTKDNTTQVIVGRKSFKHLSMAQLILANPNVRLNDKNITHIALNSIRLHDFGTNMKQVQFLRGQNTFSKLITVGKLTINGLIDSHINISTLIHDSVKTDDVSPQQIVGHKHFLRGLRINRLTTDGAINGIQMDQVFNLNPAPPTANHNRLMNGTVQDVPISGRFIFSGPVFVNGHLDADLINGISIRSHAVRRFDRRHNSTSPQLVFGKKTFARPLIRVTDSLRMVDPAILEKIVNASYPLVNGLDMRRINAGLRQQMQNPPLVYIDDLEITGNLNLPMNRNVTGPPRVVFGENLSCPIDLIRTKLVHASGLEEQVIDRPVRVHSLRARSISVNPGALNGVSFPDDFVIASPVNQNDYPRVQSIFGHKTFDHISVAAPFSAQSNLRQDPNLINLGSVTNINNITYNEIQTFIGHERQRNATGEALYQTLNVHGNIYAKKINGYNWPDDILLKSFGSNQRPTFESPLFHRRIYSPLVFLNSSNLRIENQLVLRGPVQLSGYLNGVNLTEFARQSVTYGDKDLLSATRPIRNKVFLGGITVNGELRSQGLIDGVNIDDMRRRVVTIGPSGKRQQIISQKAFMADLAFLGPISLIYMNELPIYNYMKRIQVQPENRIQIFGKKTVTGALVINRNLVVQGKINGIDFAELQTRAISLAPGKDIHFNKTLTIEGDAYMDNLLADEQNGIIDGIRIGSLMPIYSIQNSVAQNLVARKPASIQYEKPTRVKRYAPAPEPNYANSNIKNQLDFLRQQIVSMNLVKSSSYEELVAGFIDSATDDIGHLYLPDQPEPHSGHEFSSPSYLQLDQFDLEYVPTIYHLSVGVTTNYQGQNVTSVYQSIGGSGHRQIFVLPVESPNNAKFLTHKYGRRQETLFLLISQDYTTFAYGHGAQCPRFVVSSPSCINDQSYGQTDSRPLIGSIHVYLFQTQQNSSLLTSSFFDLYQTLDLPAVDSFESFDYQGSTYALAISRSTNRIYLLVVRGYTGFQIVSYMDVPYVEKVRILHASDGRPVLLIYQTNGQHRRMDSVII